MNYPKEISRFLAFALLGLAALLTIFRPEIFAADTIAVEPYTSAAGDAERAFARGWEDFLLGRGEASGRYSADLPFSFVCGERSSRQWVRLDTAQITSDEPAADGSRRHLLTWTDPETSLVCEMELFGFADFPALEWTVRLRNDGSADTPPIHDFFGLDTVWNGDGSMPILHRSVGSPGHEDDFTFLHEIMHASMWNKARTISMNPDSNIAEANLRSYLLPSDTRSSAHWLPFFNYQTGSDGLIVALGWSGSWRADFRHNGDGNSSVQAGLGKFDSVLHPGETVRAPLVMVLYWTGEMMHGQNMFRRMVLDRYSPRIDGKIVTPPISGLVWGGVPSKEHLEIIEKLKEFEIPLDVYWFDAGWYGTGVIPSYSVFEGDWGPMAGDWRPNPNWHSGTLKPVADAAHAAGMKFLLWVEPCRAIGGRPVTNEHPEYFLPKHPGPVPDYQTVMLDLAREDAWQWAFDTVSGLIGDYDLDWYEEDFNLNPGDYLGPLDTPDRVGMADQKFVTAHMALWDALREKHPSLAILNCASGGRKIDLETIRRGQPLWRSDYNCFPEATAESTQDQSFGIQYWLPIQGSMIRGWMIFDKYEARSSLTPGMENALVAKTDDQWRQIRDNVAQAQRCKKYFFGDYYPLTNRPKDQEGWMAYHLYLPEEKEGMLLALRREKSPVQAMTFDLATIDPDSDWTFTDYDSGESWAVSGKSLRTDGFRVEIPNPRGSRLLFYKRAE